MRAFTAALFLVLAANATAQQAIEGTVLSATTGTPVPRALVTFRHVAPNGFYNPLAPGFAADTNSEGKFELTNIEPGSYSVEVQRSGFVTQPYKGQLALNAGNRIKGLDFKLIPHAVVAGRVLDTEGNPLANVQVRVLRLFDMNGKQSMSPVGFAQTDDTGNFRIAGLAAGRYYLGAANQDSIQAYTLKLLRYDFDKPQTAFAKTFFPSSPDEAGARPIDLASSQTLSGLEIRMKLERVFRVRGKLHSSIPVKDLRIEAVPLKADRNSSYENREAILNEDGSFEIAKLFSGPYVITAMQAAGARTVIGKAPIDIAQENLNNVLIGRIESVTMPGTIRIEGASAGKQPSLKSIQPFLSSTSGNFENFRQTKSDALGSFQLENVSAGKFRLGVQNLPAGVWLKAATAAGRNILAQDFDIPSGPIEITLATGVGSINGIVSGSNGQPVIGSVILLGQQPRPDLTRNIPTDQNGRFNLPNLAPGDYSIYAIPPFEAFNPPNPAIGEAAKSKARKITIAPNSQNQVDLTLAN